MSFRLLALGLLAIIFSSARTGAVVRAKDEINTPDSLIHRLYSFFTNKGKVEDLATTHLPEPAAFQEKVEEFGTVFKRIENNQQHVLTDDTNDQYRARSANDSHGEKKADFDFVAKFMAPSQLRNTLGEKETNDAPLLEENTRRRRHRQLQPLCELAPDNSTTCFVDNVPREGLVAAFFDCPVSESGSLFDCPTCSIVLADTIPDADPNDPRCNSCSTISCGDAIEFDCSNLFNNDPCAAQNCAKECIGPGTLPPTLAPNTSPPPTSTSPPSNPTPSIGPLPPGCDVTANGTLTCLVDDRPLPGYVTIFAGCSQDETGGVNPGECLGCEILLEQQENPLPNMTINSTRCSSCQPCGTGAAVDFDCNNLEPNDNCAARDCNGTCVGTGTPAPTVVPTSAGPTTAAPTMVPEQGCVRSNVTNTLTCVVDDRPVPGYVMVFVGCKAMAGTVNYAACQACDIFAEDEIIEVDENDPQCNSCTPCGNNVAFDCSNLFPQEECAVLDCNGLCIGNTTDAPSTTSPTTFAPTTTMPSAITTTSPPTTTSPTVGPTEPPATSDAPSVGGLAILIVCAVLIVSFIGML